MSMMRLPSRLILAPSLALFVATAGTSTAARADECPAIPSASKERRSLAKDWFGKAESAEGAGDAVAALKAYQCSLRMVPHAFTAFNLARLAEKTGDLELAVEAYGSYLQLSPEAQDKAEIEAKVEGLNARIAALRDGGGETKPPPRETTPDPDPVTTPQRTLSSEPMMHDTGRVPDGDGSSLSPAVWIVGGVGVAALAGGIVLNLGARSKMDECRKLAAIPSQTDKARSACDAAKPRAYASYGLLGLAAAAVVADAVLIFTGGSDEDGRSVSFAPLPGGGAVYGGFRF